ncbi:hypothetical protein KUTeg_015009 [Tegillarca granosa]|uniref:EF-hand domain-containing protein n=1 Tax=Tegillarca granosa TaxID=220873 RepID=A0ABQ9ETI2_TEGGR|nr:hypothetical protein KUTeg_015009 [Tegillarca granosa]
MLQAEYNLEPDQAQLVFDIFDADHNDILSIWEFQQFYTMFGDNVHNLFNQFKQMEVNGTGNADIEKVWETLKTVQCATGQQMEEKDLEQFIKSTAGESKSIDLSKFLHLYCRIKQWKYRD